MRQIGQAAEELKTAYGGESLGGLGETHGRVRKSEERQGDQKRVSSEAGMVGKGSEGEDSASFCIETTDAD